MLTAAFGNLPSVDVSGQLDVRDENVGGLPYSNTIQYSHSSFLRTMQEIFGLDPSHGYAWLGGASSATDMSDLFKPDSIK